MVDHAHFRAVLLDRKNEILARLQKVDKDLGRTKLADSAERAAEAENDEVLEEFGHVGADEIKAIDAALKRIDEDRFGLCVKCGDEISPERLEAVPYTPFCKNCASAMN